MDIKSEFTLYCGPSVLYKSHTKEGRMVRVFYTIPAVSEDQREVVAHLSNGLAWTLLRAVRRCAESARNDAYRRTGHRDADMQQLLSGRTV